MNLTETKIKILLMEFIRLERIITLLGSIIKWLEIKICRKHSLFTKILFLIFLFEVLFFGRVFILRIDIAEIYLSISEVMSFLSLAFIIINRKYFFKLPNIFYELF